MSQSDYEAAEWAVEIGGRAKLREESNNPDQTDLSGHIFIWSELPEGMKDCEGLSPYKLGEPIPESFGVYPINEAANRLDGLLV